MVRGLDLFRARFRDFEGAFILIGGAACDEWFSSQGLTFRATQDLDLVLIIEVVDASLVAALRGFIAAERFVRWRCDRPFKPISACPPLRGKGRGNHESRRQGDP